MFATFALLAFGAAGCCGLAAIALRDHRAALAARAQLLDPLAPLLGDCRTDIAPDGFPRVVGRLPDGRQLRVELVADTLVTRRLPQLWLIVSLTDRSARLPGSIGALTRPTGAEFYALTPEFPDRLEAPAGLDAAVLVRTAGSLAGSQIEAAGAAFRRILSDPAVKEAVATAQGFRIVRQAAQGDRAAHIVFRQVRFPLTAVDPGLLRRSLADAEVLRDALHHAPVLAARLSA